MRILERSLFIVVIGIITIINLIGKHTYDEKTEILKAHYDSKISSLNYRQEIEQISEDFKFDSTQLLINMYKDTVNLESLSESSKLVLYLNPNACNVCLDSLLYLMQSVFMSEKLDIAIISSSYGYRDLLVQLANNQYPYPHYCLLNDLNIPLYKEGVPFLFFLDRDLIAKNVFMPDKSDTERTKAYLNMILKKKIILSGKK